MNKVIECTEFQVSSACVFQMLEGVVPLRGSHVQF